jgi:hypothetical protein
MFLDDLPFAEPVDLTDSGLRFAPLVSWLVAAARPTVTVAIGGSDARSVRAVSHAAAEVGGTVHVGPLRDDASGSARIDDDDGEAACPPNVVTHASETAALAALRGGAGVGVLHLSIAEDDESLPDLAPWFELLVPGAVLVVSSTTSDLSSSYADAKRLVSDRFASTTLTLGLATEALVAQVPVDGAVPLVDRLGRGPNDLAGVIALLDEQLETAALADDTVDGRTARAAVVRLVARQSAERDAYRSALLAYRDMHARLSQELAETRGELAQQVEAARLEREHLVGEFMDRLDVLSAKISTSASRAKSDLELKDREIEAKEEILLAYAGRAAEAEAVIADMRRSSSWRVTAPIRLLSRVLRDRSRPHPPSTTR